MLKTIIVDDEQHCLENLKELLLEIKEVDLIGLATSVSSAYKMINDLKPDLLILDVDLTDGTGFMLLEKFSKPSFQVVFATGHNEFAIKAFKHSAVDYLLKPVEREELKKSVEKAYNLKNSFGNAEKLELMIKSMQQNKFSKIAIPSMTACDFVEKDSIVCCESEGSYTHFYLKDGRKLTTTLSLKKATEVLPEINFFRVHKSFIININYIAQVLKSDGGVVIMENEIQIPIARRRKDEFMNLIGMKN